MRTFISLAIFLAVCFSSLIATAEQRQMAPASETVQWLNVQVICINGKPALVRSMSIDGREVYLQTLDNNGFVPMILNDDLYIVGDGAQFKVAKILTKSDPTVPYATCESDSGSEPQAATLQIPDDFKIRTDVEKVGCEIKKGVTKNEKPVFEFIYRYTYTVVAPTGTHQFHANRNDDMQYGDYDCLSLLPN